MKQAKGGKQVSNKEFKKFYFTGVTKATPVCFNPTNEQLKELRGYASKNEPQYTGIKSFDGLSTYTKLTLLMKFNPKEQDGVTPEMSAEWPEEVFFNLEIPISNKEIVGRNSGSNKYSNMLASYDGLVTFWNTEPVPTNDWTDLTFVFEEGEAAQDLEMVHLKEGQTTLLNLLYAMHNKAAGKDDKMYIDLLETDWEDIVAGDVDELNTILDLSITDDAAINQFRTADGQVNPIGVLLGVRSSEGFTGQEPFVTDWDYCFSKRGRRLGKKLSTKLLSVECPFKHDFQADLAFKVYDVQANTVQSAASMPTADVGNTSYTEVFDTTVMPDSSYDEDMPF